VRYPRGGRRRGRERGLIGCNPGWNPTRTIDAAKKYVVSSTLDQVDWNAELVHGDLGQAVRQLKRKSGKGLFRGRREASAGVDGAGIAV